MQRLHYVTAKCCLERDVEELHEEEGEEAAAKKLAHITKGSALGQSYKGMRIGE